MPSSIIHAGAHANADLIPIRMCNEFVYCPRLFYLEHVQGMFVESADTVEGSAQHVRAQRRGKRLKARRKQDAVPDRPEEQSGADILQQSLPTSLSLSSEAWGVTGKVDLVEIDGDEIVAVETKHGPAPSAEAHRWRDHELRYAAWPCDVVQIGLYMALLREAGMPCAEGRIYYRGSGDRITISWSDSLEFFLRDVLEQVHLVARLSAPPAPLLDSPKCLGCSLNEVCLPDEHLALTAERGSDDLRRIVPGRDDRTIVHVATPGSLVRKDGDGLVVCPRNDAPQRIPLKDVSHVALFGPSQITEQCLQHLLANDVPVSHHTTSGRLIGYSASLSTRNVVLRRAQYRAADDLGKCLAVARGLVMSKIRNQRTLLRRYRRAADSRAQEEFGPDAPHDPCAHEIQPWTEDERGSVDAALRRMKVALGAAERANDIDALRGHEGDAAAEYFKALPSCLPPAWKGDFAGRSRRPPRDRVNALLGFGYALLVRDAVAALARVGLDPMLGLYHTMIPGRPAAALDLIEPFRAAWVDAALLRLIATRGISRDDFQLTAAGVFLSGAGRRAAIRAYERRADELTTHPRFGYRMSYRRLLELEVRVLGKWLLGEIEHFTPMWTR